jgi:hypothetical protein
MKIKLNQEPVSRVFDIANKALKNRKPSGAIQEILREVKPVIVILSHPQKVVEEYEHTAILSYPPEGMKPITMKLNFPMQSLRFMGRNVQVAYSDMSNTAYLAADYGKKINELVALGMAFGLFN